MSRTTNYSFSIQFLYYLDPALEFVGLQLLWSSLREREHDVGVLGTSSSLIRYKL